MGLSRGHRAIYGAQVHLWGPPHLGLELPLVVGQQIWGTGPSIGLSMGHRPSMGLTMWHMATYWALYGALYGSQGHLWGTEPPIGLSMGHRAIYGAQGHL